MADNPLSVNLDINEAVRDLSSMLIKFKENRTYDRNAYDELLDKYITALRLVDQLKDELDAARANKIPSSEEIDNIGKALGMLDQFGEALPKLAKLQKDMQRLDRK